MILSLKNELNVRDQKIESLGKELRQLSVSLAEQREHLSRLDVMVSDKYAERITLKRANHQTTSFVQPNDQSDFLSDSQKE